jgi:hypothetical protein
MPVQRPILWGVTLLLAVSCASHAADFGFRIRLAETQLEEGVYRLRARIDYELSDTAVQALRNGVPLTFLVEIGIYRQRSYLWDDRVATVRQRYRLEYHALSERHIVTNLNTGAGRVHQSLEDALSAIGRIEDFPLLDGGLLRGGARYLGEIRASLDLEALPMPLRALAYLNPQWRLASKSYAWPLQP